MGGENKVVESDETFTGGKARNSHKSKPIPKKHAVVTLVERDGRVRAKHVPNITAKTVGEHLSLNVDAKSHLMTDDSTVYIGAVARRSPVTPPSRILKTNMSGLAALRI